jgi:hypothetical protein
MCICPQLSRYDLPCGNGGDGDGVDGWRGRGPRLHRCVTCHPQLILAPHSQASRHAGTQALRQAGTQLPKVVLGGSSACRLYAGCTRAGCGSTAPAGQNTGLTVGVEAFARLLRRLRHEPPVPLAADACNIKARYPLYERQLPTWTVMGFPLVIHTDQDIALKIVEADINAAECFAYCDAAGNPSGYTGGIITTPAEGDMTITEMWEAGTLPTRQDGLGPCGACSDPAESYPEDCEDPDDFDSTFKVGACGLTVAVELVSGEGDDTAQGKDVPVKVGVWDPKGSTANSGLCEGACGGSRGRRMKETNLTSPRRMEEDQGRPGGPRLERWAGFQSGSLDETPDYVPFTVQADESLNPFIQGPRGSLVPTPSKL